jgi:hypothetical protein
MSEVFTPAADSFAAGLPTALYIWVLLTVGVATPFVLLALLFGFLDWRRSRTARAARLALVRAYPSPFGHRAAESRRYADEIGTAADRATEMAERRRDQWLAAHVATEAAWKAYDTADAESRRLDRAAAYPTPDAAPRTPEELHKAAQDAFRRGQIDSDQLLDVLFHRNGFDPQRHPFELDALLRRAARDRLLRSYRAASAAEREAWRQAEAASAARKSLVEEARLARGRAVLAGNKPVAPKATRGTKRALVYG